MTAHIGYDDAGNVTSIVTTKRGVTLDLVDLTYTYATAASPSVDTALRHTADNVLTSTTTIYTYDPQDRLSCATTSTSCTSTGYGYGYHGDNNMTSATLNGTTTTLTYNNFDQLSQGVSTGLDVDYDYSGVGEGVGADNCTTGTGSGTSLGCIEAVGGIVGVAAAPVTLGGSLAAVGVGGVSVAESVQAC